MTNRLAAYIISKLREVISFSAVAREVNLSVSTVIRIFDIVQISKPKKLPNVLAIDEFKGNTGNHIYLGRFRNRIVHIFSNKVTT